MKSFITLLLLLNRGNFYCQDFQKMIDSHFDTSRYEIVGQDFSKISFSDSIFLIKLDSIIKKSKSDSTNFVSLAHWIEIKLLYIRIPYQFSRELFKLYFKNFRFTPKYYITVIQAANYNKISGFNEKPFQIFHKKLYEELFNDCDINKKLKKEILNSNFLSTEDYKKLTLNELKLFFSSCSSSYSIKNMRSMTKSQQKKSTLLEIEKLITQNQPK